LKQVRISFYESIVFKSISGLEQHFGHHFVFTEALCYRNVLPLVHVSCLTLRWSQHNYSLSAVNMGPLYGGGMSGSPSKRLRVQLRGPGLLHQDLGRA